MAEDDRAQRQIVGRGPLVALKVTVRGLLAGLVLLASAGVAFPMVDAAASPETTPVVLVHGYSNASCPGTDVTHDVWGGVYLELSWADWQARVLPVSFYACDSDGVDITGYGPSIPDGATTRITSGHPRVRYKQDTSIRRLAHDLAWFVYLRYTEAGRPVDLVGSSLGGLITRTALYRVAVHDAAFPPYLFVARSVTISAPHAGIGKSIPCGDTLECHEMRAGSDFMNRLVESAPDPQGAGGTKWTQVGSSAGCDLLPVSTTLAMSAEKVDYLSPCYQHSEYVWDFDSSNDATIQVTDAGTTTTTDNAPRSLAWLVQTLQRVVGWQRPADPAPPVVRIVAPTHRFRLDTALRFAYTADDPGSGVAGYDVRYRQARWNGSFGDYLRPAAWQTTSATAVRLTGTPGHDYCFAVRAHDGAGNVSSWTADRCVAVPLDDRALAARTTGWTRAGTAAAYLGTVTRTWVRGARLRLAQAHATGIALVVATCPTCGRVGIVLNGVLWRTVSTYAATKRYRVVRAQTFFGARRIVTIGLKNLDHKRLIIDGLAVAGR
jgi:hypothetical protein